MSVNEYLWFFHISQRLWVATCRPRLWGRAWPTRWTGSSGRRLISPCLSPWCLAPPGMSRVQVPAAAPAIFL